MEQENNNRKKLGFRIAGNILYLKVEEYGECLNAVKRNQNFLENWEYLVPYSRFIEYGKKQGN